MATLYITELLDLGKSHSAGAGQMAKLPAIAEQAITIAAGSTQSTALNINTRFVRLMADSVCSVAVGSNPTATATNMRLAANVPEYFEISGPQPRRLAVITNT